MVKITKNFTILFFLFLNVILLVCKQLFNVCQTVINKLQNYSLKVKNFTLRVWSISDSYKSKKNTKLEYKITLFFAV